MINLLPPDVKKEYIYAKINVTLRNWILICLIALVGLGAIATYGMVSLKQSKRHNNAEIVAAQNTLQKEKFSQVEQQVQDFSNSFQLVVKVLSQEILFSKLISQMGAAMPKNAYLNGIKIDLPQGGLNISANAVDFKSATQVQVNLADPNSKLFSKVDIVNITCGLDSVDKNYPCNINMRALFSTDNPFLFIISGAITN